MPTWTVYLVITIIIALAFIIFYRIKKSYLQKISKLLYKDNKPDEFLKEIDSFSSKLFFNKKVRLQRKLDAYVMKHDIDSAIEILKELEGLRLSFGQKVSLYEKEVNFYVQNKMYKQAEEANNNIQELNKKVEIPDLQKIADECNFLIKVYVDKDSSIVNDLIDFAEKSGNESVKGLFYFRAAKLYYYKQDNKMVDKYLDKSYNLLHKTAFGPYLEECKKDHKKVLDK